MARLALDVDPIMVEVFRTRVEAIAQEAGAAIENTAISPIVTETKDYSVTILDGAGTFIRGAAAVPGGDAKEGVREGDGWTVGDFSSFR